MVQWGTMKIIDLRSDTVTHPTAAMRDAMRDAVVGDDVFGDDPTVRQLEETAAHLMGKEMALYVASGTMANLVCVLVHCQRGDEVILGDQSHIFLNEVGGMAALGGVQPHTLRNQRDGTIILDDIKEAIRGDNVHWPRTRLICLENTHNRCYGAPLTSHYIEEVSHLARAHRLTLHLDGARIFNAAVAHKCDVKEFTRLADSVSFCLSKGLSAPIGSLICGDKTMIGEARRLRKMLGGGMRQVGVIAAPGIVALRSMIERLKDDHEHARLLAEGIAGIQGLRIEKDRVQTNILYFELSDPSMSTDEIIKTLQDRGVLMVCTGPRQFRMVTHHGIERDDIETTLNVLAETMRGKGDA